MRKEWWGEWGSQAQGDFQFDKGQREGSWSGEAFRRGVPREGLFCGGDAGLRRCFSRLEHALLRS